MSKLVMLYTFICIFFYFFESNVSSTFRDFTLDLNRKEKMIQFSSSNYPNRIIDLQRKLDFKKWPQEKFF